MLDAGNWAGDVMVHMSPNMKVLTESFRLFNEASGISRRHEWKSARLL